MAKSLQDQLITAGLIDKKKANKIKTEQRKDSRKKRGTAIPQDNQQQHRETSRKRAERDRALNRQRQEKAQEKAVTAQVRQLVQANRVARDEGGDIAFNFVSKGKVRKIYVDRETRDRISAGKLAIVSVDSQYDLVPSSLVDKLRQRSETCVVFHNDLHAKEESLDDDYSEHKVPDDLIW